MKRPTLFLLTAMLVGVTVIVAAFVPSATARKSVGVEAGDIAFVDVFTLIDRALVGEEMAKARTDFSDKSTATLDGLQQQMQSIQAQLTSMKQDDPNAGAIYGQYQQLQSQIQMQSQQINQDYQSLIASQISEAYAEIYQAANDIAAEQGYSFVFATRADGKLVQTDTITGITQEILARPLVTPPSGVNITEPVRVKLGYPEESADVYDNAGGEGPDATQPGGQEDGSGLQPEGAPDDQVNKGQDDKGQGDKGQDGKGQGDEPRADED